jgi:hypothetical protein
MKLLSLIEWKDLHGTQHLEVIAEGSISDGGFVWASNLKQ